MYNYYTAMKADTYRAILDNPEMLEDFTAEDLQDNKSDIADMLFDSLFVEDSVTGNASGSYTFCRATAEEYVRDNMDLLRDAIQNFDIDGSDFAEHFLNEDWEYFDVLIRLDLLNSIVWEVVEELDEVVVDVAKRTEAQSAIIEALAA